MQDPASILETGLCVWRSGQLPDLDFKTSGRFLDGLLALMWTGKARTGWSAGPLSGGLIFPDFVATFS